MNYANCNAYNADFDGDEMNCHFVQVRTFSPFAQNRILTLHSFSHLPSHSLSPPLHRHRMRSLEPKPRSSVILTISILFPPVGRPYEVSFKIMLRVVSSSLAKTHSFAVKNFNNFFILQSLAYRALKLCPIWRT
jgi:hypothetical protein